jgi:hypothetical protein
MPPQTLSAAQKRHLEAFMRFCPGAHKLRRFVLQFRDAALEKCQETEYVDRFGQSFRIPVHGPVCENAAPRSGSSEAIPDNAMEQWPY